MHWWSTEVDWRFLTISSHLQMTLAMRRELKFPADKRFRVKLTPMNAVAPQHTIFRSILALLRYYVVLIQMRTVIYSTL